MSILVVGTVAFDSVETPFGSAERILGGSATYISLAARFFSGPVRLVSVVGADFSDEYPALFAEHGVDTRGLVKEEAGLTFAWEGRYHYDLNTRDTIATHLNVMESFSPVVPEDFRKPRIVCLGNMDPSLQSAVLDQVVDPQLVVCDTMNLWIEHTPEALRETLKRVDVLVINDSEARELSSEPNLVKAARKIREMGPRVLIIKKGEHGALLFADDIVFSAPAFPLEEINDPTGAGDAFAGGFIGFLHACARYDADALKMAVIYGSTMASFTVEKFGPQRLIELTTDEIVERTAAFTALSAIPEFVVPAFQAKIQTA